MIAQYQNVSSHRMLIRSQKWWSALFAFLPDVENANCMASIPTFSCNGSFKMKESLSNYSRPLAPDHPLGHLASLDRQKHWSKPFDPWKVKLKEDVPVVEQTSKYCV